MSIFIWLFRNFLIPFYVKMYPIFLTIAYCWDDNRLLLKKGPSLGKGFVNPAPTFQGLIETQYIVCYLMY